LLNTGNSPNIE